MTPVENAAHELLIALKDIGLVWDDVTGSADDWKEAAEALIAERLEALLEDSMHHDD